MSTGKGFKSSKIQIRVLGGCDITHNGESLPFESNKARALLVYLAMDPAPHQREKLMGLFWGGFTQSKAQRNLRHSLWNIRKVTNHSAGIPVLVCDSRTVSINPEVRTWLDAAEFEERLNPLLASGKIAGEPENTYLESLSSFLDLYRGDFLEGFYLPDAQQFDEWVLVERERLRMLSITGLEALIDMYNGRGEPYPALDAARRLLVLSPWREEVHRQVMLLLDATDQREQALLQFKACRRMLAEELGIEPSKETTELYQDLLMKAGHGRPLTVRDDAYPTWRQFPQPATPFIGRVDELKKIHSLFKDPNCRLLTITGPGGIGKTRLSIQTAEFTFNTEHLPVVFVPLAEVASSDGMTNAMIDSLGFTPFVHPEPATQLLNYLRERRVLIVLDNFEHLIDTVPFISEIIRAAPGVRMIITSRERLNLYAEWVLPLEGLNEIHSAELFVQSARRVNLGFSPSRDDSRHITQICQMVGGMPLAIELAAGWTGTLSCGEIAHRIEFHHLNVESNFPPAAKVSTGHSLEFLSTQFRDVPERQRNLWALFEHSWNLLDPTEQEAFAKLSVFRGGFELPAARIFASSPIPILTSLVDKSLLQRAPSGRYNMHNLVHEFASAKLLQQHAMYNQTIKLHAQYYADYTATNDRQENLNYDSIEREVENIHAAWSWGIANRELQVLEKLLRGLYVHYEIRSDFPRGEALIRESMAALDYPHDLEEIRLELPDLLPYQMAAARAAFLCRMGDYEKAGGILDRCLPAFRRFDSRRYLAFGLFYLGDIQRLAGHPEKAQQSVQESQEIFKELGDPAGEGFSLNVLGLIATALGQMHCAKQFLEESRLLFSQADHTWGLTIVNINLAGYYKSTQDYQAAETLLNEALALTRKLNHRWAMATCYKHLGEIAQKQGKFKEAQAHYQHALRLGREIGDRHGMLQIMLELAETLITQKQPESAIILLSAVKQNASTFPEIYKNADKALAQLPECFTDSDAVSTTMIDQESDLFRVVENILANAVNEHPCK